MKILSLRIILSAFVFVFLATVQSYSQGLGIPDSDTFDRQLIGTFDLRERESFIQLTNTDIAAQTIHIQIFNVNDNCNENNFFDVYTPDDTHVYNLRDIQTNDGNPSGVVLPDDAYGIFAATYVDATDPIDPPFALIGNLRILDDNGYEYRTNLLGTEDDRSQFIEDPLTFNFNNTGGVILSDVVGIILRNLGQFEPPAEVFAADILETYMSFDVNIVDVNETIFSCRDIAFSCVNDQHPLLEELLIEAETSVASFEYGINNAIPHSKGGELLCPGNNIPQGIVTLENFRLEGNDIFFIFVGLNNGNGRGSFDAIWNGTTFFNL